MQLAGQQKMGYYPANPDLASRIGRLIAWPAGKTINALDPCCGCGEALEALVPPAIRETTGFYAVELARNRYEAAAVRFGAEHTLWTAFEQAFISTGVFSAAWLNPPYDDELGGGKRTELEFLQRVTPLLVDGGVLVFLCAERAVSQRLNAFLTSQYEQLHRYVYPFDEPGYSNSNAQVFIGVKRKMAGPPGGWLREETLPELGEFEDQTSKLWTAPPGRCVRMFRRVGLTDEELCHMADASAVWRSQGQIVEVGRPLLPLKLGHIPMVLASGRLNGCIGDHFARARIEKIWETIESRENDDGKVIETQRQKILLTIRCLARHAGEVRIYDFAQKGKAKDED